VLNFYLVLTFLLHGNIIIAGEKMADYNKELIKYTGKARAEDVRRISEKIGGMKKGPVAKIWASVSALFKMARDPEVPWQYKAVAVGALIYLISPIDAIPDIMPFVGLLDDVAVITAAVASLGVALTKYKEKKDTKAAPESDGSANISI
jgi:uncharacterized membrane protein YkvA (DUF1232 family)